MNATIYTQKRDELTDILGKILEIKELNSTKKSEFEEIRKKCHEDQFNIVLVGEFQGGKSTTFNTFCDGREISPRGALVKTSACRLTARNLSDVSKQEFATVQWKTGKELILNIEDILYNHIDLKTDLYIEFKPGDEIYGLSDILDLKNVQHKALITEALEKEWVTYENNKGIYSAESLDILRIATIIIRFVNNSELTEYTKKTLFTIDAIAKLIVFPQEWEMRWNDGSNANFKLQEVLFAFIGGIDCHIHSANLARLGCSITDCPGLFASKWDTQVALDTIPKSDAIIYLLRGDRAIGTEETKALREIRKMPAASKKLFYAINMKVSKHIIDTSIIPNDIATIRSIGLSVEDAEIKRYHALLAFLGEFGYAFIHNKMEDSSKKMFTQMAQKMLGIEQSISASWMMLANQQLMTCAIPPQSVTALDQNSIDKVTQFSGFKSLFTGVEDFIIKNKAFSILITNGAERASFALTEIASSLKNREDEATMDVNQRKTELFAAKKKLEEFQHDAATIVNNSFKDDIYEILINNFYEEVVLQSTDEMCMKIAYKLEKKLTTSIGFALLFMSAKEREKFIRDITHPIYGDVMNEVIANRSKIWMVSIAKGENKTYLLSIVAEGNKVKKELEEKWRELSVIEFNFSPVEYPNITQMFDELINNSSREINTDNRLNSFYKMAKLKLVENIIDSVVGFFQDIWNEIKKLFNEAVNKKSAVVDKNPEKFEDLNYKAKQLFTDVKSAITSSYGNYNNARNVKRNILLYLKDIGDAAREKYRTALAKQQQKFEVDYKISEENLNKSTNERMKIAGEAKIIREEKIEPYNRDIAMFNDSIKEILEVL